MSAALAQVVEDEVAEQAVKQGVRLVLVPSGEAAAESAAPVVVTETAAILGISVSTLGIGLLVVGAAGLGYYLYRRHKVAKARAQPQPVRPHPQVLVPIPPVLVTPCPAAAQPAQTPAEPTVVPVPASQVVPASATRNATQTCPDEVLNKLQAEKDQLAREVPPFDPAAPSSRNRKRMEKVPCSRIKRRLRALEALLAKRWEIQNKCFGGVPDERHKAPLKETEDAIKNTKELEKVNCKPGHPMALL